MDDFLTLNIHPKNIVQIFASLNNAAFLLEAANGQFFKLELKGTNGLSLSPEECWFQNNENFWQHSKGVDLGVEFVYRPRISQACLRLFAYDTKDIDNSVVFYRAILPLNAQILKVTYGALCNAIQTSVEITL